MKREKPETLKALSCIEIRKRMKRGIPTTEAEQDFVSSFRKQWPRWYRETEKDVFEQTRPFGSYVETQISLEDGTVSHDGDSAKSRSKRK